MPENTAAPDTARLCSGLGLCAKAGALIRGVPLICEALRSRQKPALVLQASDTSPNSAKRLVDKCRTYGVRLAALPINGEELAAAIGKTGTVVALGITQPQICRILTPYLNPIFTPDPIKPDTTDSVRH